MEKKKTNGKRNRAAGHKLETEMATIFRNCGFPHVITSRAGNRSRDSEGIDLVHSNELEQGRFPYNVQCKNYSKALKYWEILARIPKVSNVINVIIHKFTRKKPGGTVFHPVGYYAILPLEDFIELVKAAKCGTDSLTDNIKIVTRDATT